MRITIRSAKAKDAAALLAIYAPYVRKTAITFEYAVPSRREFAERIRRILARYPYLVAEADGKIVGYAYAGAFKDRAAYDWAVEATVYVKEDCKRLGIGRRLYKALEKALKAQGILNMNACIASPIRASDPYLTRDSIAFHARLGFKPVGIFHKCGFKFHRWYDMLWMEKSLGPHTAHPRKSGAKYGPSH